MSDEPEIRYSLLIDACDLFRSDLQRVSERDLETERTRLDRIASDPVEKMFLQLVIAEIRTRDVSKLTNGLDEILGQISKLAIPPDTLAKIQTTARKLRQNLINFGVGMRVK